MKLKTFVKLAPVMVLIVAFIFTFALSSNAKVISAAGIDNTIKHRSHVLIDTNTGKILTEQNAHERHPIASVTKLMTILLTLEEIDNNNLALSDNIIVSENASGMGGSQIFLDANKEYTVENLLKSVILASANDSSVALAEHISGSEANFVARMNERASELGLVNTNYSNCTGLPSNDGYSSAYDQAIVLKNVISHDIYHNYSSIWMEDFIHPSGRITQMTNTNKLSRFYEGCTGGKTGSTNQAKYCLAVSAERNNTSNIAVVLGAENSKDRFKLASDLLNHGFNNFETITIFGNNDLKDKNIHIKGSDKTVNIKAEKEFSLVVEKGTKPNCSLKFNLPNQLSQAVENQPIGNVEIVVDGVVVDTINVLSCDTFAQATIWDYFKKLISMS